MLSRYKWQKIDNILIENNVIFQKFKDTVLINYTNSKKGNWLKLYQSKSLFVDNNNNNANDNNGNSHNNNIKTQIFSFTVAVRFLSQSISKSYPVIFYLFACVLLPFLASILSMMRIENLRAKNHKRYTQVFDVLIRRTYFVSCVQEI